MSCLSLLPFLHVCDEKKNGRENNINIHFAVIYLHSFFDTKYIKYSAIQWDLTQIATYIESNPRNNRREYWISMLDTCAMHLHVVVFF
jgi:hypothetical protein